MNKPVLAHFKNKYPDARVHASENAIDVYRGDEHLIAYRKDGAGMWVDQSAELGASHRFCLAPLPRDARVHRLHPKGHIERHEKASERESARSPFICPDKGYVRSMHELKAHGWEFDEYGDVRKAGSSKGKADAPVESAPAGDEAPAKKPPKARKK